MRSDLDRALVTAAVALVVIAGWAVAAAGGLFSSAPRIVLYVLANLILIFDTVDLIARIWLRRLHGAAPCGPSADLGLAPISRAEQRMSLRPYAVIASIRNESDDIDRFTAVLAPFKECVWLIDDDSKDGTLLRLRREGWNCIAGAIHRNKPGAIAHLLKLLPREIETIVIMDPDVRWAAAPGSERAVLEQVISDLQRSGAAALTPRIQARRRGWLVECQAFEYELACGLGRKSLGDSSCNSGVSVYRRAALEEAMTRHSLSVYAEDFENSLLLLAAGERIYYDDRLTVSTEAKRSLQGLFSQRVGWSFGCAKVFLERVSLLPAIARRNPLCAYQYVFYLGLSGIVLLPLKLASIAVLVTSFLNAADALLTTDLIADRSWNDPLLFALWYGKSLVILLIACMAALPRGDRARHLITLPLFPFYALFLYLPMTLGYANVLTMRAFGRRLYADHYDSHPTIGVPAARMRAVRGPT